MENKKEIKSSRKLIIKIIIPLIIVIAIVGIWFIKNADKPPLVTSDNPDFSLHVTEEFDFEKLKSYGLPIMIDFGADYCPPCREMTPILVKLNQELQGKAIIKYIDVEKYPELAQDYPISVIPTQVFFDKDGKPYVPSDAKALGMIMYTSKDTGEHVFTVHEGIMIAEKVITVLKEMGMEE